MGEAGQDPKFEELLHHLKHTRGFDFTGYKRSSLIRRINKRMQSLDIESYEAYIDYLEANSDEFAQLFNTILINVTNFFRDGMVWDFLRDDVFPYLLSNRPAHETLRIWSAGCATGQEAYTLAMTAAEILGIDKFADRVKIYATDADEEALQVARLGAYSAKDVSEVPPALIEKYFEAYDGRFVFRKELRRSIIFGRHDLVMDAPISRVDVLTCRNTLMYFNTETQGRILNRFHFALRDSGFLVLGKAEMMFSHMSLFVPYDLRQRVFRKVLKVNLRDRMSLTTKVSKDSEEYSPLIRLLRLREAVFDNSPVAQIVVDTNGYLVMTNERARTLLNLSANDLQQSIHDLALAYRLGDVANRLERVYIERLPTIIRDMKWSTSAGDTRTLEIQIIPLMDGDDNAIGVSIAFLDLTAYKKLQDEIGHANQELETAYEEVQSTNEELETTNEELQSTVEELETTNEELQSTNEELETINEELQSTNEELQTMNDETNRRSEQLNQVNLFLEMILSSLPGGAVVLDLTYAVQMWNHKMEDLWGLRSNEVIGKNILTLDIGLPVPQLLPTIRAALAPNSESQEATVTATNRRGRSIQCRVTCMPLVARTSGEPQGVILQVEEVDD